LRINDYVCVIFIFFRDQVPYAYSDKKLVRTGIDLSVTLGSAGISLAKTKEEKRVGGTHSSLSILIRRQSKLVAGKLFQRNSNLILLNDWI